MIAALLALQLTTCPPNPPGASVGAIGRLADEYVTRMHALGAFDGVVLVASHDTILLHRGYGRSNDATCAPMKPDTRFDIASIAKQFTGAAILVLESSGRVRANDPISRWLPVVPADKAAITIKELLTHTSGLPREYPAFFARAHTGRRDDVGREILAMPLEAPHGTQYSYSNLGSQLLATIVERASGMSFEQFMQRELLDRAGLTQTRFISEARQWPDADVAHPYWDLYDARSPRERVTSWYGLGGSQIMSSAGDLYRWFHAARTGRVFPDSLFRVWTRPDSGRGYAYGWNASVRPDGAIGVIFHGGGDTGAGSEFRYYPAIGLTVIVLTNRQLQDQLMQSDMINEVASIARGRPVEMLPVAGSPPSTATVPSGRYQLNDQDFITAWRSADGRLWLAPEGQQAFNLVAAPDSTAPRRVKDVQIATEALVDSLSRVSCERVAPALDYPQAVPESLIPAWCQLQRGLGSVVSVERIGVRLPGWSKTRAFNYTRMKFSRGQRVITWLFDGDGFIEMWQSEQVQFPQSYSATEESPGVLLLFDWFRGSSRRLVVERTAGKLQLAGTVDGGWVRARLRSSRSKE